MGRIGVVLSFTRVSNPFGSEVKVDIGGGDIVTADVFLPPGCDDHPLPGDYALLVPGPGTGSYYAIGFSDPTLQLDAAAGESVRYSRSAPGVIGTALRLRANGTAAIELASGTIELSAAGGITAPADVVGAGKSLSMHTHAAGALITGASGGSPVTGTTGAPS